MREPADTRTTTAPSEQIARHVAATQQITHIGSWQWDLATNAVSWSDELYRIYGLEPRSREITLDVFLSFLHPDERERVQAEVGAAVQRGGRFSYHERIVRADGEVRDLDSVGEALVDESGRVIGLIGTCRDITDELRRERTIQRLDALATAERAILEQIASGMPLAAVLEEIARVIERHATPTLASILLLDATGARLRQGAAPSLPEAYNRAIEGAEIGPVAGSCGTAAFRREPVVVTDIETDPLWAPWRDLALAHQLRACWSTPIFASGGRVAGTFALYYREPRSPTQDELDLIARATHLVGIAIQRSEIDEQQRALSARIEAALEDERTSLAREIHDELGQALTALKMDLSWIGRRAGQADARDAVVARVDTASRLTDEIIGMVRRIASGLRPGVLDDLGLVEALEWQGQQFEERTGITCVVRADAGDTRFERGVATALFRIFQEALTNVVRHAAATHVEASLRVESGRARLVVRDDGRGITDAALRRPTSLGLLGMRERAARLGGTTRIVRGRERGTVFEVEVPLAGGAR